MERNDRQSRADVRKAKRKRQILMGKILIAVLILVITLLCIFLYIHTFGKKGASSQEPSGNGQSGSEMETQIETTAETQSVTETETEAEEDILEVSRRMAAMYDYDGAIDLLKNSGIYAGNQEMEKAVTEYETAKAECEEYPLEEITHVFFHTMIYDVSKAFDGDSKESGYNQVMTTIDEFNKIIDAMYEKGYVMVSLHDMAVVNEDGSVSPGSIMLPPGKKPFILSQDDVSYYHYMDGDGMASRLIVDENGKVKNEYIEDDGSVSVGDYDMIPLIDTFVEEHPDFSYRGAKGVIALTGYEGVLGYRTDEVYQDRDQDRLTEYQVKFLEENPDFDFDADVAAARAVAAAMKEDGWEFASHTWGHISPRAEGLDKLRVDTQRWQENVASIVGDTDVIIFAFGADIGDWEPYSQDNEYFSYLHENGFRIFCNVDSAKYWVQFGENFMRQGRRNLDGYRMYYDADMLDDLFDATDVFDSARPVPVPTMGSGE